MANSLQRISGGTGCDIVTSANGHFVPRRGKIYAIVVREDDTTIGHIKEDNNGVITTVRDRSWIGVGAGESTGGGDSEGIPTLIANELLIPDYPIMEIEVITGSIMVYYEENAWKHYRR
jgi:hypothetical protein